MKVSIKYENVDFKKHKDFVGKFISFLQKEYPLKNDVKIIFLNDRVGDMTTGSRRGDNVIKVLVKDRLNRDILRTLAHEWVHEYQFTILNRKKVSDIGDRNENEANAFAGSLIKQFEKENPDMEEIMYESKGIEKKINILTERIILTEKIEVKNDLLTEMKKIGIDKLPYSYSSLQRFVDSKTMNIHYNKHYKGYVDKLNKALKNNNLDLEEIIKNINKFDEVVRNNAGGAFNHALFWKMLSPKKQKPTGEILEKIKKDFGNIKKMKDEFNQTAKDRFGSGWAWLYLNKKGDLKIMSTPNQDNPLMNIIKDGGYPLLGLDVWEHSYYLKYQNKRDEYINNFWDVVNWEFVNDLFVSKNKKNLKENINIKKILTENTKTLTFPLKPREIKELVNSQYNQCGDGDTEGCIGKIETQKCTTNVGVIGGKYSEKNYGGDSMWSIVNRFDTNSKIHKEIILIWSEKTNGEVDLSKWIKDNTYDLFSNNGEFTERLVELNSKTVTEGKRNEDYSKEIIRKIYKLDPLEEGISYELYEHCSGDVNDREKGQDIVLKFGDDEPIFFQVKPFYSDTIKLFDGGERGYHYKLDSWNNHNKYKEENVDIIVYVDRVNDKYIMFRNDHSRILTISNPNKFPPFFINYYELPISTNLKLNPEQEKKTYNQKKQIKRDVDQDIKFYEERIKYFQNKIKELGGSSELNEMVNYYKGELGKLIVN
jgi:Fe-Mn family superoxide dismutase